MPEESIGPEGNSDAGAYEAFIHDLGGELRAFTQLIPSLLPDPTAHPYLSLAAEQMQRRFDLLLTRRLPLEKVARALPDLRRGVANLHARIEDLNLRTLATARSRPPLNDIQFGKKLLTLEQDQLLAALNLMTVDPLSLAPRDRLRQLVFFPGIKNGIRETVRGIKDTIFVLLVIAFLIGDPEAIFDALEVIEEEWGEVLDWIQWFDDLLEEFGGKETDPPGGGAKTNPPPAPGTQPPNPPVGGTGHGSAGDCGPSHVSSGPIWGPWFTIDDLAVRGALARVRRFCADQCHGACNTGSCTYAEDESSILDIEERDKPGASPEEIAVHEYRALAVSRGRCQCNPTTSKTASQSSLGSADEKPSCAKNFPLLLKCRELEEDDGYRFRSKGEALAALANAAQRPESSLEVREGKPATGGPCPKQGKHHDVHEKTGNRDKIGSLMMCPCCTDTSGGPVTGQRWRYNLHN